MNELSTPQDEMSLKMIFRHIPDTKIEKGQKWVGLEDDIILFKKIDQRCAPDREKGDSIMDARWKLEGDKFDNRDKIKNSEKNNKIFRFLPSFLS